MVLYWCVLTLGMGGDLVQGKSLRLNSLRNFLTNYRFYHFDISFVELPNFREELHKNLLHAHKHICVQSHLHSACVGPSLKVKACDLPERKTAHLLSTTSSQWQYSSIPGCNGSMLREVAHPPALCVGSWGILRPDVMCNPSFVFWVCPKVSPQLGLSRITP